MNDYMKKPVKKEFLSEKINQWSKANYDLRNP